MEYLVKDRKPVSLFNFFEDLCAIPHGSGNEGGIADYLCKFAQKRGLEYYRDEMNNVLIKKSASQNYINRAPVMLQAHTDMVCEKTPESRHDFEKDGLTLKLNGDLLTADGTTLGADDGIGVAAILALLDDKELDAPKLECLFTVCEETGMDGALGFDYTKITARNVVNLDNSVECSACCGCAGGIDAFIDIPCEYVPRYGKTVLISVSELVGGHSGVDIDKGGQNAVTLLAKALLSLYQVIPFCLVTVNGGSKPNVIPSSAYAAVSFFSSKEAKAADKFLRDYINQSRSSFIKDDKKLKYSFKNMNEETETAVIPKNSEFEAAQFTYKATHRILALLAAAPSGVIKRMPSDSSQILSSVNLGVLRHDEKGIRVTFFARSCYDFEFKEIATVLKGLGKLYGANVTLSAPTPGWKFIYGQKLQKTYDRACREVYGKPAEITNVHAGLECGAIIAALNKIDGSELAQAITIGPIAYNIHTVNEALDLPSCERFYALLSTLLGMM